MVEEIDQKCENEKAKNNDDAECRARSDNDEREDHEDGEITGNDGVSSSAKPPAVVKHPLEHSWTFWFDNPSAKSKQTAWGSSMRPIYTFSHVEVFWSLYNNIHHPSKLAPGADLYCFKNKIEPKWEDPICANGGKWTASFHKGKSDTAWLYTLLAMIGEQFIHGDEICGAVVNVRARQEKIAIWTKNAANEAAQVMLRYCSEKLHRGVWKKLFTKRMNLYRIQKELLSIGKQWKEFLDYNDTIGFIFHEDAKKHDRNARNKYTA